MNELTNLQILFLAPLAVWRISKLITAEEPFEALRAKLGVTKGIDESGDLVELPSYMQPTFVARGITCLWCTSFWVSLAMVLLIMLLPFIAMFSILWFAFSAIAIFFDTMVG